jgi:hypothetical protein
MDDLHFHHITRFLQEATALASERYPAGPVGLADASASDPII